MATALQLQLEFKGIADDDTYGEDITYVSGEVEYPIRAVVYRSGFSSQDMRFDRGTSSKHVRYDFSIRINSHATYGRSAILEKVDTVKLKKDLSSAALSTMRVMEVIEQDLGTIKVGLRS